MDLFIFFIQILNAIQYGLLLFLLASGLTLIFGIMKVVNLAHGSFYMIGAYLAWSYALLFENLFVSIIFGLITTLILGLIIERYLISKLYETDHLRQVLLTYGLILVFEDLRSILFGDDVYSLNLPIFLSGTFDLTNEYSYPVYRFFLSLLCLIILLIMYVIIFKTKIGIIIRAGASNRLMTQVLGIDINFLYCIVFSFGVALAAFAGMVASPITTVYPGMGDQILIICFVVVVIGGIGSLKGAFVASILVGLIDTFSKVIELTIMDFNLLPQFSGVLIYFLMGITLVLFPDGIFGKELK